MKKITVAVILTTSTIYITLVLFYLLHVQVFCSRCESGNENSARHGIKINIEDHTFLQWL
jgi:hypothetical protein